MPRLLDKYKSEVGRRFRQILPQEPHADPEACKGCSQYGSCDVKETKVH